MKNGAEYILEHSIWIPQPPDVVFQFFSSEKNLDQITPSLLKFRVLQKSTAETQQGTIIDYALTLHGVPFRWKTLIDDWVQNEKFVDFQLKGPFKFWHHLHSFKAHGGGTQMDDQVRYVLPCERLGQWIAGAYVRRELENILRYRDQVIRKLF